MESTMKFVLSVLETYIELTAYVGGALTSFELKLIGG